MRRKILVEAAADHHFDQRRPIEAVDRLGRDVPPVAQDGNGVAQPEDFLEAVTDVDAGHASCPQPRDQRVEPVGFMLRQAARRLVEDDQARALADGGSDLDELLLADGQVGDGPLDIEHHVDGAQHGFGAMTHPAS